MKQLILLITAILFYIGLLSFADVKTEDFEPGQEDTGKLRFDGLYSTYANEGLCGPQHNLPFKALNYFVLLDNKKIYYNARGGACDSPDFLDYSFEHWACKMVGTYTVHNDTMYANIPVIFSHPCRAVKLATTHYKGYVKNADTVVGWRMVPPYPKLKEKYKSYFVEDTIPKLMYFLKNNSIVTLENQIQKGNKK